MILVRAAQQGRRGSRYPLSLTSVVMRCFRIVVMERLSYSGHELVIKLGEVLMIKVLKEAVI
jgi:hypothetical protein